MGTHAMMGVVAALVAFGGSARADLKIEGLEIPLCNCAVVQGTFRGDVVAGEAQYTRELAKATFTFSGTLTNKQGAVRGMFVFGDVSGSKLLTPAVWTISGLQIVAIINGNAYSIQPSDKNLLAGGSLDAVATDALVYAAGLVQHFDTSSTVQTEIGGLKDGVPYPIVAELGGQEVDFKGTLTYTSSTGTIALDGVASLVADPDFDELHVTATGQILIDTTAGGISVGFMDYTDDSLVTNEHIPEALRFSSHVINVNEDVELTALDQVASDFTRFMLVHIFGTCVELRHNKNL